MSNQNNYNSSGKTLGRGLSSLLGKDAQTQPTNAPVSASYFPKKTGAINNQILELSVESIKVNPHQPRTEFNEKALNELVLSIKEHGVIQPLIVTQTMGGGYELIAGERRLRASKLAGLKKIPAIIRSAKESEKLELSLIENIQRHDLNSIEKAKSYKKMIDEFDMTHETAANRLGISRAQFSNTIRLLNLPADVQQGLVTKKISLGQAKVLLEIKDENKQKQFFNRATQNGMTVEDTRREVQKVKVKSHIRQTKKNPQFKAWESEIQSKLGTKVSIRQRGKIGGVIEIEFYSEEELAEIINKIKI